MSVKFESIEYKMSTDRNCTSEYAAIYLNIPTDVTSAARPCFMMFGTQAIVGFFDVNGEATELSASDKDIPVWAAFNAPETV